MCRGIRRREYPPYPLPVPDFPEVRHVRGPLVPRREVPAALPPEFVAATAFVSAVALGSVLVGSLVPYFYKLFNALIVHLLSDIYRKNSE